MGATLGRYRTPELDVRTGAEAGRKRGGGMTYRELRAELRMYWDDWDAYGSVMGLWFPLAAVLTLYHSGVPPD